MSKSENVCNGGPSLIGRPPRLKGSTPQSQMERTLERAERMRQLNDRRIEFVVEIVALDPKGPQQAVAGI